MTERLVCGNCGYRVILGSGWCHVCEAPPEPVVETGPTLFSGSTTSPDESANSPSS